MDEPAWDIGDGYQRWCRGIGLHFHMVLIRPEVLAYVSGCHLKFVQLNLPNCEVVRMFHPGLKGIDFLEAIPAQGVFALAERAHHPRIQIYRFENEKHSLLCELKGAAENRFRAVRFNEDDLIMVLSGAPDFCISVWRWGTGEQLLAVDCLESGFDSDLLISPTDGDLWVEWSKTYITYYELVKFGNDKTVIRSEIALPKNQMAMHQADPRFGDELSIDIVSVTFDFSGSLFVLDHLNGLYKIHSEQKSLISLGTLDLSQAHNATVEYIVAYGKCVAAVLTSGVFLMLSVKDDQIKVAGRLVFSSRLRKHLSNPCAPHPTTSFYGVTDGEKRIGCVLEGKIRAHYAILDLTLSEIQSICFIDSKFLGAVTEKGAVFILDANTGNTVAKWKLPFYAESILCHPLLPLVAIGTADGSVIFLEVRNIQDPRVIHRSFLCEDTEIDKLAFTCRGRYMIAGDSQRRHLFLMYGLPAMEFHYLDYSSLPGLIRAINTPANSKDKRLQVVIQETDGDECPFQINNYRVEGENLVLVASQLLEAPIKALCFSYYAKLMYAYTCENHCVGMVLFMEDANPGGLPEPDIQFEGDLPLHVSRILLLGNHLYTFGEDGHVRQHVPPAPKSTSLHTEVVVQTHLPAFDGIRDAIMSIDGCQVVSIGYDGTVVHVQLKDDADAPSWSLLGYGLDTERIIEAQTKYFDHIDLQKDVSIADEEIDVYMQSVNDENSYHTRRNEGLLKEVNNDLESIRNKVQELIQLNTTRDPAEQLRLEEFELDDDIEELERQECAKDKEIAEIMIKTLIEEREKWVGRMKTLMWDAFEVKISKINGFNFNQEVSNYPLGPAVEDDVKQLDILRHERRIEKKLSLVDNALNRARLEATAKVIRFVKKRRVKKQNIDLSKYPPHLREEMRKLLRQMPQESDSDSSDSDVAEVTSPKRPENAEMESPDEISDEGLEEDEEEDDEYDEEVEDEEEDEDEEGILEEDIPEEAELENELVQPVQQEQNEDEEIPGEIDEKIDSDQSPQYLTSLMSIKTVSSEPTIGSGGTEESVEEEEEEAEEQSPRESSEDDDEGYEVEPITDDFDVLAPESYLVRRKRPRKKRRMCWKKANDDEDDDTLIWVEEDDSSDESGSDMERQLTRESEREQRLLEQMSPEELERTKMFQLLFSGSLTYEFFEPHTLLYEQFDLAALHEMNAQIMALKVDIRRLKSDFNKAFEKLKAFKASELEGISARNARIRKIAEYFDINVAVKDYVPTTVFENPETIFEVRASEIPVDKVLTDDELDQIRTDEETVRLETEALEIARKKVGATEPSVPQSREEMLKIDIPKPQFMVVKEDWRWNAEEMEKAADYYKKVDALEEARVENRKELEFELRALLKANADTQSEFDARLKKLQEERVKHELSIRMEEVKISRLVRHIMKRSEAEAEERKETALLKQQQAAIKITHRLVSELSIRIEGCITQYNALTEKEKLLERTFRLDLGDVGYFYETFVKMYKKRPKVNFKNDKTGELMRIVIHTLGAQTTVRIHQNDIEGHQALDAIKDLDDPMQTPVGCPRSTWDRFCRLRHERIICEYEAKLLADELTVMHKALDTFKTREAERLHTVAAVMADLARQRDVKISHSQNVEFQMVLRDGQIELPRALVRRDFHNALLILKHLVDDCNEKIKKIENLKLTGLERAKGQHRTVKQIEWMFKKVQLEEKHAQEKLRDINTLRVTKEVVNFLLTYDNIKAEESRQLETVRKLQAGFKRFHDKVIARKGKTWKRLKGSVLQMKEDSERKETIVADKNLHVSDCRLQCNVKDRSAFLRSHRERMLIIMRTGYYMRLIAKNSEEIFCLEKELDRLYKKTFPLL